MPWCCGRARWWRPAASSRSCIRRAKPIRGSWCTRCRAGARRRSVDRVEALISVRGLKVAFDGRQRLFRRDDGVAAVDGVDLDIRAGETVAVVGGSGSGKTTLGRAMLRLIPSARGEIRFRGKAVGARVDREFRLASQLVFQDPYSSLDPRMRVGEIVAEPLRHVPELTTRERDGRVEAML